jgi:hypothetical protein
LLKISEIMKAKSIFSTLVLGSVRFIKDQVGINTENPTAILDVLGKSIDVTSWDRIFVPRIPENDLVPKIYTSTQTGALIYISSENNTPSVQTSGVTTDGLCYFNGEPKNNKWIKINTGSGTVSGWALTVNSGTVSGTNFSRITDGKYLIFRRDCVQGEWLSSVLASVAGKLFLFLQLRGHEMQY